MARSAIVFIMLGGLGCMRSGPIESQRPLCGDGEQIIMANTLFCVYVEPIEPVECAPEVPHRHQVEDTIICSFDSDPSPILLAAVVEATALPPLIDGLFGFGFGSVMDAQLGDGGTGLEDGGTGLGDGDTIGFAVSDAIVDAPPPPVLPTPEAE